MTIYIERLCLHGNHGLLPQEKTIGSDFYFTLRCEVNVSKSALEDDSLDGTVSYADIYDLIKKENKIHSDLLEHLVHRILKAILNSFPLVTEACLRIDKQNPPIGALAKSIGVEETLKRD